MIPLDCCRAARSDVNNTERDELRKALESTNTHARARLSAVHAEVELLYDAAKAQHDAADDADLVALLALAAFMQTHGHPNDIIKMAQSIVDKSRT